MSKRGHKRGQWMKRMLGVAGAFFASSAAFAQIGPIYDIDEVLDLEQALVGGTGCDRESTVFLTSQVSRGQILSIITPQFDVTLRAEEAGRAHCAIRIPYDVPEGYRLVVETAKAWGHASLNESSSGDVSLYTALAGSPPALRRHHLSRGQSWLYLNDKSTVSSECNAGRGLLMVNISVALQGRPSWAQIDELWLRYRLESCLDHR